MTTLVSDFDVNGSRVSRIDLWEPELKSDPGPIFAKMAKTPPFYVEIAGAQQVVMTRFEDAKTALLDHERFSNVKRPWPGTEKFYFWMGLPVVTDTDPPNHTRLRTLLAPAFSPRRLIAVEAGVHTFVAERLDLIGRSGPSFDVVADLARPLSSHLLLGLLMDIPEADRHLFIGLSDGLHLFARLAPGSDPPPEYMRAWAAVRTYCQALIEERRDAPRDDLVSNIIAAHDDRGSITTDELFASLVILYVAGLAAIVHLISWTLWRLGDSPEQLALLRTHPELLNGAIEESLRIEPIGYVALRYATGDFEYEGLRLLRDMPVIVVEGASNFDADRYPDPQKFDIRREPRRDTLIFGHGVHHCIGASVARLAARNAIGPLVERFAGLRLAEPGVRPKMVGSPKDRGPASVRLMIE